MAVALEEGDATHEGVDVIDAVVVAPLGEADLDGNVAWEVVEDDAIEGGESGGEFGGVDAGEEEFALGVGEGFDEVWVGERKVKRTLDDGWDAKRVIVVYWDVVWEFADELEEFGIEVGEGLVAGVDEWIVGEENHLLGDVYVELAVDELSVASVGFLDDSDAVEGAVDALEAVEEDGAELFVFVVDFAAAESGAVSDGV